MERQELRSVDDQSPIADRIETVGRAALRLDEAMTRLKDQFGLTDDNLNLRLGPLGTLLSEPSPA